MEFWLYLGSLIISTVFLIIVPFIFDNDMDNDSDIDNIPADGLYILKILSLNSIFGFMFGFGLFGLLMINNPELQIKFAILGGIISFFIITKVLKIIKKFVKNNENVCSYYPAIGDDVIVMSPISYNKCGEIICKSSEKLTKYHAKSYNIDDNFIYNQKARIIKIENSVFLIV